MATGANEETVKFKVELDPQGFRSQLMQLKQEVGLTLNAATYSLGQTAGAGAAGFNSLQRDIGALAGAVLTQPTAGHDLSKSSSILSGLVPGLTAPRSYDVEEWGKLNRDNLFKSLADTATRAGLALPALGLGELGSGVGSGMGTVLGGIPGALVGGVVGYMAGAAAGETLMEPAATRYSARRAISSVGGRFGISASDEVMQGVTQIGQANQMSGTETLSVLRSGLQTGAFGQVAGAEDFKQKFGQLMRGAKEISQDMHVELSEAVQHISSLQSSGFGTIQGAMGAMRMARVTSSLTGVHTAEAVALAQAGASMTVGNLGMSAQYGAQSTLANFEGVTLGLRNKTVDMEAVNQLGGRARAAQAMTMSGLGFLEGPLGRATLLAAYDTDTGQLDPSKYVAEPGMAFRSAMENVFSGGNPMRALLEFAGNRSRVASQASPEEVALSQVMTWETLARHVDPKGPITQEMLVGAAHQMGTNPDVARSIIGTTLDPSILEKRREEIRKQQALAAQRAAPQVGGWGVFGGAGNYVDAARNALGRLPDIPFGIGTSGHTSTLSTEVSVMGDVISGTVGTARGMWAGAEQKLGLGRPAPVSMFTPEAMQRFQKNSLAENLARHGRIVTKTQYDAAAADANDTVTALFEATAKAENSSVASIFGITKEGRSAFAASPDTRALFTKNIPAILAMRDAPTSPESNDTRNRLLTEASGFPDAQQALFAATLERTVTGEGAVQNMTGQYIAMGFGGDVAKSVGALTGVGTERIGALRDFAAMEMSGEAATAGLRFIASRAPGTRDIVQGQAGQPALRGLMNTLNRAFFTPEGQAIALGPLSAMREDARSLQEKMGSGWSISLDQIRRDKWDLKTANFSDLAAMAKGDAAEGSAEAGILTQAEFQKAVAMRASRAGVKAGLAGPAHTPGGALSGMDQAELYTRLGRSLDAVKTLAERIVADMPTKKTGGA